MLHLQARQSASNSSKVTVKSHSTEMLWREQIMGGKEHCNKFLLKHFVIKTSDKKYERRFDRSTVILKLKFME